MRTRYVTIGADGTAKDSQGGGFFCVISNSVDLYAAVTWLDIAGNELGTVDNAAVGQIYQPGFNFSGVKLAGTAGAEIEFLIGSMGAYADAKEITVGAFLVENGDNNPVPVKIHTSDVDSINTLEKLGATITDNVAIAVDDTLTAILAAAARRAVRLCNQGPDPVAIGGAALTWARRAIVLDVDDVWEETAAPGAVIKAICNAGKTATLGVQVVTL